jgi:superfamily II DNA or RNA helicase
MAAAASVPDRIMTPRGYSLAKTALSAVQRGILESELCVTPAVPMTYAAGVASFKVWLESPGRYYLPRHWATVKYGAAETDTRPVGSTLPPTLRFAGSLRPHQVDALAAFRAAGRNGIICLPCGYGKTFTGIAAATADPEGLNTAFIIVVHKEFLADQWSEELQTLVPGIRIGRIQGEKCEIGPDVDVAIAMIQTLCSRTYPAGTFNRFGFAIFDEVHHLGAEHFSKALQRINCRRMLGLTATPKRADGLSKVFEWYLGPIVYQILRRPKDDSVIAEALRYECFDDAYADVATNWKGDVIRARMINQIADYAPRTEAIMNWIAPIMSDTARRLLILSDRREHLAAFEAAFRGRGFTSIGYYVGGMKQRDLDISATQQVILGTFAMASEGMNIPTLNTVLLATPKSNIEQSVGRILRQKKEDRAVQPMILDVVDAAFKECFGQWNKRRKFYKECGYTIRWHGAPESESDEGDSSGVGGTRGGMTGGGSAAAADKKGVPLFVEED